MDDWRAGVILLDVSSVDAGEFDRDLFERLGHPVIVCHGPGRHGCPLLGHEGCSKFDKAHGIAFRLDLDRKDHRAILQRYRQLARPELPIRVRVSADQARRYADELQAFEVWTHEPNVADLDGFAAEVEAADRLAD
jgi:hypothetical protein